jgi:hypothetical protein
MITGIFLFINKLNIKIYKYKVGYGDIVPITEIEMIFSIMNMVFYKHILTINKNKNKKIISSGIFGYVVNSIGTILKDIYKSEEEI